MIAVAKVVLGLRPPARPRRELHDVILTLARRGAPYAAATALSDAR